MRSKRLYLKKYLERDYILLNESGCDTDAVKVETYNNKPAFDLLWVGRFIFTKQLKLAMESIAEVHYNNIRLHIVGGTVEEEMPYKRLAERLGIVDNVIWHHKVSHEEVQRLMQMADVFLFTSVAEGTPHVVLEAIANHLPVLCFDTCGQGDAVNETVGIKIPLTNPKQSVKDFAEQIAYLYHHRDVLQTLADNCRQRQLELSWDRKAEEMVRMYATLIRPTN